MPVRSKAQRRFLWATNPTLAREFEDATPKGVKLPEKLHPDKTVKFESDYPPKSPKTMRMKGSTKMSTDSAQINILELIRAHADRCTPHPCTQKSARQTLLDRLNAMPADPVSPQTASQKLLQTLFPGSGDRASIAPTHSPTATKSAATSYAQTSNCILTGHQLPSNPTRQSAWEKLSAVLGPLALEALGPDTMPVTGPTVPQDLADGKLKLTNEQKAQMPSLQPPPTPPAMQPMAQVTQQAQQSLPSTQPGAASPSQRPIDMYGPLSNQGLLNGNAGFGVQNSPVPTKLAADELLAKGHGRRIYKCGCEVSCKCLYGHSLPVQYKATICPDCQDRADAAQSALVAACSALC